MNKNIVLRKFVRWVTEWGLVALLVFVAILILICFAIKETKGS